MPLRLFAFLMILLAAAGARAEPVNAVCTTGMVADVVRNVGGDRVAVTTMLGSGVDPHLYKPTRTDMLTLMGADVVFYSGLLLEGKMTDALIRVARSRPVVAVTEAIDEDQLLSPESLQGHHDPHVWMDPGRWAHTVDVVAAELSKLDPDGATGFRERAETYKQELARLHEYARGALASVPEDRRVLVTAHDAFNYLGARYSYEVVGIQGISTESEAGVAHIENLVTLLVERKIPAVFIETTVADRNIRALIAGAAAKGHEVTIGGELFSDAMGPQGTYTGTYIGMIDHNVTTIARALGGDAPAGGMQGKLEAEGK
ncbi:MAG: metal ABC transporter solute-binding protein, Zn/Mn family [Phycisphaerales bacterium JB039]